MYQCRIIDSFGIVDDGCRARLARTASCVLALAPLGGLSLCESGAGEAIVDGTMIA